MRPSSFCLLFTVLLSALPVDGHGYVHSVIIGEQTYPGWNPFSDSSALSFEFANLEITRWYSFATPNPVRVVRKIANDGFGWFLVLFLLPAYS